MTAARTLKTASIAHNNTAGATTAMPRLTATGAMTSRRGGTGGRSSRAHGHLATVPWTLAMLWPVPGHQDLMVHTENHGQHARGAGTGPTSQCGANRPTGPEPAGRPHPDRSGRMGLRLIPPIELEATGANLPAPGPELRFPGHP